MANNQNLGYINNQNSRKYFFKQNYFDELTYKSSFILGYIFAEGSLAFRNHSKLINIESCDLEIMKFISEEFNIPLKSRKRGESRKETYYLAICSKNIYDVLVNKYNLSPKKSNKIILPKLDIPLMRYFIRGYFEGDGSISVVCNTPYLSFVSISYQFLYDLRLFFIHSLKVRKGKIDIWRNYHIRLRYTKNGSRRLLEWLYGGNNFLIYTEKYYKSQNGLEEVFLDGGKKLIGRL